MTLLSHNCLLDKEFFSKLEHFLKPKCNENCNKRCMLKCNIYILHFSYYY